MRGALLVVIAVLATALGVALFFSASLRAPARHGSPDGTIKVAATIFPLFDIVRNVGGERVNAVLILPPGASAETFSISPDTVRALSGAKAVFAVGAMLDDWASQGIVDGGARLVTASNGIAFRTFSSGAHDPHYWLSFDNAMKIAANVADELSLLDPQGRPYYGAHLASFRAELERAKQSTEAELAPYRGKSIAVFHDAWGYFADAYGLNIAAIFEPFPGKEPTPQYLAGFIEAVRAHSIGVVFIEPQLSSAPLLQIARDLNVSVGTLDDIGGRNRATDSYISLMQYNVDTIVRALRKSP